MLTSGAWARNHDEFLNGGFPWHANPGKYSVQAFYHCIYPPMIDMKGDSDLWYGRLESDIHYFKIGEIIKEFSITAPCDGDTVRGLTDVMVSFSNYDPLKVELRIDDGPWIEVSCIIGCSIGCPEPDSGYSCISTCFGSGTYNWDTSEVENGEHKIKARLQTHEGTCVYDSIYVIVDNQVPVQFSIEAPCDGDTVKDTVSINGYTYCVDSMPNINKVFVSIDREEYYEAELYYLGVPNPSNQISIWFFEWDTTRYSDGEHRINVKAYNDESYSYDYIYVTVNNEINYIHTPTEEQ